MTLHKKQRKPLSKRAARTRRNGVEKQVARQKKTLLSLAGIGASEFTDISVAHDTYLHEKP
jgi:hypothetical protein